MDSLVFSALLPLAQAADSVAQPGQIAGRILRQLLLGESFVWLVIGLAIAAVVQVLAYWMAAKVVVGEPKGSLPNAIKLWALYLLVALGFVLLLGVAIPVLALSKNSLAVAAIFGGGALLALAVTFILPMKIFEVGLLRAFGVLIIAGLLMTAAKAGSQRLQGKPAFGRLPQFVGLIVSSEQRDRLLKDLASGGSRSEIDLELDRLALPAEKSKSFPDRQADLRKVFEKLTARQKVLPPDNKAALETYQRQRARYEELLATLKADYAAAKAGQPAAPAP